MWEHLFNEQMSSNEARMAFFRAVDGKTKEEIEQLKAEYSAVLPAIRKREHDLSSQGWFID